MYRKVLIPVDGSDCSRRTVEHAISLSQFMNIEPTLFHVVEKFFPHIKITSNGDNDHSMSKDKLLEYGKKLVYEFKALGCVVNYEKRGGAGVSTKIVLGDPADEIINEVKEGRYDLVVIGNRGANDVFLLGSVSSRVIKDAACPVMVIR